MNPAGCQMNERESTNRFFLRTTEIISTECRPIIWSDDNLRLSDTQASSPPVRLNKTNEAKRIIPEVPERVAAGTKSFSEDLLRRHETDDKCTAVPGLVKQSPWKKELFRGKKDWIILLSELGTGCSAIVSMASAALSWRDIGCRVCSRRSLGHESLVFSAICLQLPFLKSFNKFRTTGAASRMIGARAAISSGVKARSV